MVAVKMSAVHHLREFIRDRLTAAAEEIFSEFERTFIQYQENLQNLQNRGLDWRTEINRCRTDLREHHDEDLLTNQQLCIRNGNSTVGQKDVELSEIKEEQEEFYTTHQGEQQDVKMFIVTSTHEESDDCETKPTAEQLLSQDGNQPMDQGPSLHLEPQHHTPHFSDSLVSASVSDLCEGPNPSECQGKEFRRKSQTKNRHRTRKGMGACSCRVCGKSFSSGSYLKVHMRSHTCERPFSCAVCEKGFKCKDHLLVHMRTHTGEKPYSCETCGKGFCQSSSLTVHMRTHTSEKPYSCHVCRKSFSQSGRLIIHMRTHTGERPYSCQMCGKSFSQSGHLMRHMRTHTGENL
ncbi:uncharacterized protein KZ484_021821 [Pholidichthys leucotaenia]